MLAIECSKPEKVGNVIRSGVASAVKWPANNHTPGRRYGVVSVPKCRVPRVVGHGQWLESQMALISGRSYGSSCPGIPTPSLSEIDG